MRPLRRIPSILTTITQDGKTASYHKVHGVALLKCGRAEEARKAFQRAIGGPAGAEPSLDRLGADEWTAAYFLDRVTADQFVARWCNRATCLGELSPLSWYYIGLRMELEGKPDQARDAYRKAVEAGRTPRAHLTANWAAWRLGSLEAATGDGATAAY